MILARRLRPTRMEPGRGRRRALGRLRKLDGPLMTVVAVMFLAACGSQGRFVDSGKAAQRIQTMLADQTGLEVEFVSCPPPSRVVVGATFVCVARVEGQIVDLDVTETDNVPSVRVEPTRAIVSLRKAEALIAADINHRDGTAATRVDCGSQPMMLSSPGDTFTCVVSGVSQTYPITVTVQTVGGRLDYTPKR